MLWDGEGMYGVECCGADGFYSATVAASSSAYIHKLFDHGFMP